MTRRALYLPLMVAAAVAVACLVALLSVSEKAEATFPGKNGKIVYAASSRNGFSPVIYTINPNGRGKMQVTIDTKGDYTPAYSPDGKRIACAAGGEIYTINVGGGGKHRVTNDIKDEQDPSYSPDGKKIAFTGFKGSADGGEGPYGSDIYTIDVGGGGKSRVTYAVCCPLYPSWGSRP